MMHHQQMVEARREQLAELLAEVTPAGAEKRTTPRLTFFGPVVIIRGEEADRREISCFSRDISANGIGLLHDTPLELGPAVVKIPRRFIGHIEIPCSILWCRPCGEGWHVAGAQFLL